MGQFVIVVKIWKYFKNFVGKIGNGFEKDFLLGQFGIVLKIGKYFSKNFVGKIGDGFENIGGENV